MADRHSLTMPYNYKSGTVLEHQAQLSKFFVTYFLLKT